MERKVSPATRISYLYLAPKASKRLFAEGSSRKDELPCPVDVFVFIPGGSCPATDFIPLISSLSEAMPSASFVSLDTPACGETSPDIAVPLTVKNEATLYLRLVNEIAGEIEVREDTEDVRNVIRIVVGGHSRGCRSAIEVAAQLAESQDNEGHNTVTSALKLKLQGIILIDGSSAGLTVLPKESSEEVIRQLFVHTMPISTNSKEHTSDALENTSTALLERSSRYSLGSYEAKWLEKTSSAFAYMLGPSLRSTSFGASVFDHLRSRTSKDMRALEDSLRDVISWDRNECGRRLTKLGNMWRGKLLVLQSTTGSGMQRRPLKKDDQGSDWMQFVKACVDGGGTKSESISDKVTGIVVEDSWHWVHVEKVQESAKAILHWVKNL